MEDLTKQQIVLLTLLVSFVTSMATGVVTVSLMGQNQFSIVQTINRVVERTIERPVSVPVVAAAGDAASNPVGLSGVISNLSEGVVHIKPKGTGADGVTGFGIILSHTGLVLTDKTVFELSKDGTLTQEYIAVLATGEEFPLKLIQSEISGDVAFAAILVPPSRDLPVVTWSTSLSSMKLGDALYAFSGKTSSVLETGMLKKIATSTEFIDTTIVSNDILVGTPLFTEKGEVVGFKTTALQGTSSFYPVKALRPIMPQISR